MATSRRRQFGKAIDFIDAQAAELKAHAAKPVHAHALLAQGIEGDYIELVSGKVSERELRRLGRPFAKTGTRGRRRGKIPTLPINVQSGRLKGSIRLRHVALRREHEWTVGFDRARAGKSALVLSRAGLKRMVPRGFQREIERRAKARHLATKRFLQGRL